MKEEIPTKTFYMGNDIESMTKEELVEVVKQAVRERDMFMRVARPGTPSFPSRPERGERRGE